MSTIVIYSETEKPENRYPRLIVSPLHPGPCCLEHMKPVGKEHGEEQGDYVYKRCAACGFTVKYYLRVRSAEFDGEGQVGSPWHRTISTTARRRQAKAQGQRIELLRQRRQELRSVGRGSRSGD
ncbi:MAG TPA: hypothetical protein VIG69_00955 [Candidatus Methylomirabilis sp.]|jgi:hypothetical protein